ncbi:MAG TPA: ABC transporter permease, partial [Fimbriimonadaceae bacterium]|nr:ABC transporter permease [Fimbriimonadaceae bacterium]
MNEVPGGNGIKRILRPLAPTTYLLRNAGKTLPLTGVILLAVMLVAGIVSMIDSIPFSIRTMYSYSRTMLGISPRGDPEMTAKVIETVESKSPVPLERVVVCRASGAQVRSIVGKWPFVVLGLEPNDLRYVLKKLGGTKIVGRLPESGKPEAIVSEPVARNLNLKIGSTLLGPNTQETYSPKEVKVVGIAKTQEWLMLNDIDYHRMNHFPPIDNVLVFAKNLNEQEKLDRWAVKAFKGQRAQVFAYYVLDEQTNEMFSTLFRILNVVIGTLVLVITIMMAMLINIYQAQRIVEYGLLQAIGYTKRQLLGRALREVLFVVVFGWILGV